MLKNGSPLNLNTSIRGADVYSRQFGGLAQDLTAAGAVAGRGSDTFITAFETNGQAGVQSTNIRYLNQVGLPINSQVATHFSVAGQGFVPVKDQTNANGNLGFTRDCTFDIDANKNFVNNLGQYLQVFMTDQNGNPLSPDVSSTTNLVPLNVGTIVSPPAATANISMGLQLPSDIIAAPIGTVKTNSVSMYDSLGAKKNLTFTWTRTDASVTAYNSAQATQSWTLSVQGPAGSTVPAPYQAGMRVEFNAQGQPVMYNTQNGGVAAVAPPNLAIQWGAGSPAANSTIALGLGAVGTSTGIASVGSQFSVNSATADGSSPGSFKRIDFDENGYGTVTFSNNTQVKHCRIPVATFNNINGLGESQPGIFVPTGDSGPCMMYFPKDGGTGALAPGTYEGSSVNATSIYVNMIQVQKQMIGNLKAIESIKKIFDRLDQI